MNKNWSNTALVAYSLLPKIVQELDFKINLRVNSAFQSRHLKIGVSNEQLIVEIMNLIDEKRKMVNLHFIVSSALKALRDQDSYILTDRILNKRTFQQLAEDQNVSLRTIFRRFAVAETAMANKLRVMGYGEKWFEEEYGNDKFIKPIYLRIRDDAYYIVKNM